MQHRKTGGDATLHKSPLFCMLLCNIKICIQFQQDSFEPVDEAKNSATHQYLIMRDWRRAEWLVLGFNKNLLPDYLTHQKMCQVNIRAGLLTRFTRIHKKKHEENKEPNGTRFS